MNWNNEARRILRSELTRRDITYGRLVRMLEKIGVEETERSVSNKLSRGTFSFVFFLQCMRAIGADTVDLSEKERVQ